MSAKHRRLRRTVVAALAAAAASGVASADMFWTIFNNWSSAMAAAGAPVTGFRVRDVLTGQAMGTPVSSEAFAAWGVHMQSTSPLELWRDNTLYEVWGGSTTLSMTWDIVLDTPVHAMYINAFGSIPISLYLGDQLVSQPWGSNPIFGHFEWFGVQTDQPFDRIRIQYEGAPDVSSFSGIYLAMPVPAPAPLAVLAAGLLGRRRRSG